MASVPTSAQSINAIEYWILWHPPLSLDNIALQPSSILNNLLSKLKGILPSTYFLILKYYLSNRQYQVSQSNSMSFIYPMCAGIPQGSILGLILYTIYTTGIPTQPSIILYTFTCILFPHIDPHQASESLRNHLKVLEDWFRKWRFKINEAKITLITFT